MPKRSRKPGKVAEKVVKLERRRDVNQLAKSVIDHLESLGASGGKNPHAVALGRKGGQIGGKRRAEALSPEQRSEAARKAVTARWNKARSK